MRILLTGLALLALCSCADLKERGRISRQQVLAEVWRDFPTSAAVSRAKANAALCATPIPATRELSRAFRYGCFCGENHPGLSHPSGKSEAALSRREREELAILYYQIKPVDAVDAACQAHDVCWLLSTTTSQECNEQFESELDELTDAFDAAADRLPLGQRNNSQARRCWALAGDIEVASLAVMASKSPVPGRTGGRAVGRLFANWFFAPRLFIGEMFEYPRSGEKCDLPQ